MRYAILAFAALCFARPVAASGLPEWKTLLRDVAPRMPGRRVMIDDYLSGKLPTLSEIPLEESKPGFLAKVGDTFTHNPFAKDDKALHPAVNFAANQDLL